MSTIFNQSLFPTRKKKTAQEILFKRRRSHSRLFLCSSWPKSLCSESRLRTSRESTDRGRPRSVCLFRFNKDNILAGKTVKLSRHRVAFLICFPHSLFWAARLSRANKGKLIESSGIRAGGRADAKNSGGSGVWGGRKKVGEKRDGPEKWAENRNAKKEGRREFLGPNCWAGCTKKTLF